MQMVSRALTCTSQGGLANVLLSPCTVSAAYPVGTPRPHAAAFQALWDTGATNSVITQSVVTACGLQPIGIVQVGGVHGQQNANVYLISLLLPNSVDFNPLRVTL